MNSILKMYKPITLWDCFQLDLLQHLFSVHTWNIIGAQEIRNPLVIYLKACVTAPYLHASAFKKSAILSVGQFQYEVVSSTKYALRVRKRETESTQERVQESFGE